MKNKTAKIGKWIYFGNPTKNGEYFVQIDFNNYISSEWDGGKWDITQKVIAWLKF